MAVYFYVEMWLGQMYNSVGTNNEFVYKKVKADKFKNLNNTLNHYFK